MASTPLRARPTMDTPFIWVLSTTLAMRVRMRLESSTISSFMRGLSGREIGRGRRASLSGQGGHGHNEFGAHARTGLQPELAAEVLRELLHHIQPHAPACQGRNGVSGAYAAAD